MIFNKFMVASLAVLALSIASDADARMRGYNNTAEIQAVKQKVNNGVEPWKSAYSSMLGRANGYLNAEPPSVTYDSVDKSNKFRASIVLRNDSGHISRDDYTAAIQLSKAMRYLGLAYTFTGDAKYAEKAIDFINVWCVNPKTLMTPTWESHYQPRIEQAITIGGLMAGADMIMDYPGWKSDEKQAFLKWTNQYSKNIRSQMKGLSKDDGSGKNNHYTWATSLAANVAVVLNDKAFFNDVVAAWRKVAMAQSDSQGFQKHEIKRVDKSLHYSMFSLNSMLQTAEVARHNGVDLYNYRQSNGMTLEKMMDLHAPFSSNISSWKYSQDLSKLSKATFSHFELMNNFKPKAAYQAVISRWGRPIDEERVMGPITLTHASGAYPFKIYDGDSSGGTVVNNTLSQPPADKPDTSPVTNSEPPETDNSITPGASSTSNPHIPNNTFRGIYYDNQNFTGARLIRQDIKIDFDWQRGSPASSIGSDTFSVTWEGNFYFQAGTYQFTSLSDDGIEVLVDGEKVIDKMILQSPTIHKGNIVLSAGKHLVKVNYYERTGGAVAKLDWEKTGGGSTTPTANIITGSNGSSNNGSSKPPTINTGGNGSVPVQIVLKGIPFQGDAAYRILVNDKDLASGTAGSNGKNVAITAKKGDTLKVQFTNNLWGGASDKNRDMQIVGIKVDGKTINLAAGAIDGNKWNRASSVTVHFSSGTNDEGGTYTVKLP